MQNKPIVRGPKVIEKKPTLKRFSSRIVTTWLNSYKAILENLRKQFNFYANTTPSDEKVETQMFKHKLLLFDAIFLSFVQFLVLLSVVVFML